MSRTNDFKDALINRTLQIGLWQSLGTAVTAEICAHSGFDWLLVDAEHGINDLRSVRDQLQVIDPSPSRSVVRISSVSVVEVKQMMDAGAQTILVPMVDTAEDAEQMVRAMRYPPEGIRGNGAGVVRVSNYGREDDYQATANGQACLLVQVETKTALGNLEDICSVDGVDGIFIGPADLASSLGYHDQPGSEVVEVAIQDAIKRITAAGKAAGILMADQERVKNYISLGATFVAVGSDVAILAQGASGRAAQYLGGAKEASKSQVY